VSLSLLLVAVGVDLARADGILQATVGLQLAVERSISPSLERISLTPGRRSRRRRTPSRRPERASAAGAHGEIALDEVARIGRDSGCHPAIVRPARPAGGADITHQAIGEVRVENRWRRQ